MRARDKALHPLFSHEINETTRKSEEELEQFIKKTFYPTL